MSSYSSIDIKLGKKMNKKKDILKILLDFGWNFEDYSGMTYLPLGSDLFEWESEKLNYDKAFHIFDLKEKAGEVLGVVLVWKDSQIGGEALVWDRSSFSISLTINRKTTTYNSNSFTDISWYVGKIIGAFKSKKISVYSINWEETA